MFLRLLVMAVVFSLLQPVTAEELVISNDRKVIPVPTQELSDKTKNFQQDEENSPLRLSLHLTVGGRGVSYEKELIGLSTAKMLYSSFKELKPTFNVFFEPVKSTASIFKFLRATGIDAQYLVKKGETIKAVKNIFWELYKNDPLGLSRRED